MQSADKRKQILDDFHRNLIDFLDELIEQFSSEPNLILCRLFLKDRVPKQTIIETFINECFPHKDAILKRDDKLFIEQDLDLFRSFNQSNVNHFRKLWQSNILNEDDRKVMWDWLDSFIFLGEQYQKLSKN